MTIEVTKDHVRMAKWGSMFRDPLMIALRERYMTDDIEISWPIVYVKKRVYQARGGIVDGPTSYVMDEGKWVEGIWFNREDK